MNSISSIAERFTERSALAFKTKVGFSVAKKALETQRMEGSAMLNLIEKSSPTPKLWQPGNTYRPGSIIDFYA